MLVLFFVSGMWASAQGQGPDLIIEDVEIVPEAFRAGDVVTIRAKVTNDSRVTVSDRFDFTVKVDGARIGIFSVRLSAARQNRTFETTWEAQEGDHQLLLEVDRPRNQVTESNERNNIFETSLSVAPDSNIISLTSSGLESQANAWQLASEALNLTVTSDNLFALLELVQGGFNNFSKAMTSLANRLNDANNNWPGVFNSDNVFSPLLPHYRDISDAAAAINTSLENLDLDGAVQGMTLIQASLNQLAAFDSSVLPLADLAQAAQTLGFAIDAAVEAQETFNTDSGADAAIETLIREVQGFGVILGDVARSLTQSLDNNTADFEDDQGEILRSLSASTQVTINAPAGNMLFELIDSAGTSVLSLNGDSNRLNWAGTDNGGRALPAGDYFFRVSWESSTSADVGILTITN